MFAVGALILYIAFVPTIPAVRDFLGSSIGKVVGLAAIIYAWKSISEPVAILLVVVLLRAGAIREFADDASMKPDVTQHCEAGYELTGDKKCKKGDETKSPIECTSSQEWDGVSKCKDKAAPAPPAAKNGAPGPVGGTTGAAAATAALSAVPTPPDMTVESFTPQEKTSKCGGSAFSPV
jgi:hypothetical protein